MLSKPCENCKQVFPASELFQVGSRTLCSACGEAFLAENSVPKESVWKESDPTVCVNCGADNGEKPWSTLMTAPTCDDCLSFYRNRPYPTWVKWWFVAIVVFVIFSLGWNLRFMRAYFEMHASFKAMRSGEVEEAATLMHAAAEHVPEESSLRTLEHFDQGLVALKNGKDAEALSLFDQCRDMPASYGVDQLRSEAEIGVAFEKKDYDRFVALAEQLQARNPANPIAAAQVASALACKYAVTGDENYRQQSFEKLKAA
jgi:hypothetical protein